MQDLLTFGSLSAAFGTLFGFGYLYNRWVAAQEKQGHDEGFTAIFVVVGVFVTLLLTLPITGILLFAWREQISNLRSLSDAILFACLFFLANFAAFAASGFWMVWGSWRRYVEKRRNGQKDLIQ
jgi:phosphotransferase system  glucose/maltose/N-acetylglucosamine-specific IIC component